MNPDKSPNYESEQGRQPIEHGQYPPGGQGGQPPQQNPQGGPDQSSQGGPQQGGVPPQQYPQGSQQFQGGQPQGGIPQQGAPQQGTPQQGPPQQGFPGPQGQQQGQGPYQTGEQGGIPPQQWHQPPQQAGPQMQSPSPQQQYPQPGGQFSPSSAPQRQSPRLQPVTVEEIVQTDVITAERDTPLQRVAELLGENDVGSVVVLEEEKPIGVLTDRKLALALTESGDLSERTAGDLVEGEPVTGTTEITIFDALHQLQDAEIRRLPIVGDDGTLEGIVTLDDILVLLGSELKNVTDIIQAQSPRL